MNCKIGDMAVVVRVPVGLGASAQAIVRSVIGRIVRIVGTVSPPLGGIHWEFEKPLKAACGFDLLGLPDECLQPIRGVPVKDEVLDEVAA